MDHRASVSALDEDIESTRLHLKPESGGRFVIVDRHDRTRMGRVALRSSRHNRVRGLELTYDIEHRFRRRGFATEAAITVVAHAFARHLTGRVYASASWSNLPSRRILEGLGMRQVELAMLDWDSLMEDVSGAAGAQEPADLTPYARVEYEILGRDWRERDSRPSLLRPA